MPTTNDTTTEEDGPAYQLGTYSKSGDSLSLGDGDFVEFQMEMQTVFQRLADDIYESLDAGIREPLTNAVTAVLRAEREFDLDRGEGVIEISVRDVDGSLSLTFADNGVGITESELREVMAVIGRSTTRSSGSLAGQFGMGFLAVFKLVGMAGGFVMHTHSRKQGEEPVSGVWESNGFSIDSSGELPGQMDEDEYGTRFELILQDDISRSDVRGWVRKHSEWARVPVIYRDFNDEGQEEFNEDYGCKDLTEEYDPSKPVYELDTEYFYATMSPEANKRTILLDVPIRRNHYSISETPDGYSVDIRLKNENSVVVSGPNEGLMPVEQSEYEAMPSDQKDVYIPETELTSDDIVMPGPIGTRDSLASAMEFWSWLGERLAEKHENRGREVCEVVNESGAESLFELDDKEFNLLLQETDGIKSRANRSSHDKFTPSFVQQKFGDDFGVVLGDEEAELLHALSQDIKVYERKVSLDSEYDNSESMTVWDLAESMSDEGDVYMGCNLKQVKANVVWSDSDDNVVVELPSADMYDTLRERFGWKEFRSVSRQNIDSFDIPDWARREFVSEYGESQSTSGGVDEEELVIRFGPGGESRKATVQSIKDAFYRARISADEKAYINGAGLNRLVLFPDRSDANVSDYAERASSRVAVARCPRSVVSHLTSERGIMTFEEYRENAELTRFESSEGLWRFEPDCGVYQNVYLHLLDENISLFRSAEVLDAAPTYLEQRANETSLWPDCDGEVTAGTTLYIPVTPEEYVDIELLVGGEDGPTPLKGDSYITTSVETAGIRSDTSLYAYALLTNGETKFSDLGPEVSFLVKSGTGLGDGGKEIVESLRES